MENKLPAKRSGRGKEQMPLSLKKLLKKNRFSPVAHLINGVYPQLEPKDQAKVLLELMSYVYTKPGQAALASRKNGKRPSVAVQINNDRGQTTPQDVVALMQLAAKKSVSE
jgi:hypothetical protein